MRARVLLPVIAVLALSYGTILAWGYTKSRARELVANVIDEIKIAAQPRFEVARGTKTIEPAADERLTIENPAGHVEVLPGGPDISAEYVIYARGEDKAEASRRAAGIEVRTGRDPAVGNKIWVDVPEGKRTSGVSIDFVVTVPPKTALRVDVASADVRAKGIEGGITVHSASGDISVAGSPAPVNISTASGDIWVTGAHAQVDVRASSGDVFFNDVTGSVAARTASGDIHIQDSRSGHLTAAAASGDIDLRGSSGHELTVTTASGDIDIRDVGAEELTAAAASGDITVWLATPFSATMEARSKSGDVTVALPSGSDCRVRATTASGNISSRLNLSDCSLQKRSISGRLGAGRGSVEVSTASGDIELLPAH